MDKFWETEALKSGKLIEPFFVLKTTIGNYEVSTVNLRGQDDWFETIVFDNKTGNMHKYGGVVGTMDDAWSLHRMNISELIGK